MKMQEITSLPVYPRLGEIADTLARDGLMMLQAEPGAGKTTLVPWHLLLTGVATEGKILLLQPRRIAARAAAERIAALLGERAGETVGLRTRQETLAGSKTRLEVVTEGVLTRIIQNDPSLSKYHIVIFDEFHERNLQGDLALALAWECREALRPDLQFLFMSATPPGEALKKTLGDIPVIDVPGRSWPVEVFDRPPLAGETPWQGAARLAREARELLNGQGGGDILVFLPGFYEIRRTQETMIETNPELASDIVLLHGKLPPEAQRRVLLPADAATRRIILATNVAETSLTIPGVRAVVDSGLERRVAFHPRTGMDHWETVEISEASASQRRGRAGRLGPGICLRWQRPDTPRRKFSPPEILMADLTPLVLETALWGAASALELTWITPPPAGALRQAEELLKKLDMLDDAGKITALGKQAARLGLHPRLGRMLLKAAGRLPTAAVIAAILEEGDPLGGNDPDFRDRLSAWAAWKNGMKGALRADAALRIEKEAERIVRAAGATTQPLHGDAIDPSLAGSLLLLAYPDRAAQRIGDNRLGESARLLLTTGRAARVKGALAGEEFLVVADMDGGNTEARVFLAAPLDRGDLEAGLAGRPEETHQFFWEGWTPHMRAEIRLGSLLLGEKSNPVLRPEELKQAARERLAKEGIAALPWNDALRHLLARCRFAGRCGNRRDWPDFSDSALLAGMEEWLVPFGNWDGKAVFTSDSLRQALAARLGWKNGTVLDELAPEFLVLPSGTRKRMDYESGDIPIVAARLQEFFGCRETPRLCGEPVLLHLLSPAGRPMQITRDLDGFWERSYPDVRRELRGRYPRHPWPDDPRAASPTSRAKNR